MARTTDEILAQILQMLPDDYATGTPLLSGIAASQRQAEIVADTLAPLATIGSAAGSWLTLHADGIGIRRASGETDASLRFRLRNVEEQVTRAAILKAVNAVIAPDVARLIEWYEAPYLDDETDTGLWLDSPATRLSGGPNSFLVLIPRQSTGFDFGSFLDDETISGMWLDHSEQYIGESAEDPKYATIVAEVERIRAAGVFWRLVIEQGA